MLKTIHKHQGHIITYIIVGVLCASMLIFGIDVLAPQKEQYALKIGETEITYTEFSDQRRAYTELLRRQYGNFFNQLMEAQNWKIDQQVVDKIIPEVLLNQLATEHGLFTSDQELREYISNNFPEGSYLNYLRQTGKSAKKFEGELGVELRRAQLIDVISSLSLASETESNAGYIKQNTKYKVRAAKINSKEFLGDVKEPTEDQLTAFYEENGPNYEVEPRVSYTYLILDKENFKDKVELQEEDAEQFYIDHMEEFKDQARAKVYHIQMNFPPNASPKDIVDLKQKAAEIRDKVLQGEDFAALVLEHSDDITTKTLGGSLGWLSKGDRSEFDEEVFALGGPGVTELVEADYGFHIVQIEAFEDERQKEFDEVKEEISNRLRTEQAPAYAAIYGQELFDKWLENEGLSLAEFGKQEGYQPKEQKLAFENVDPELSLGGLTKDIMTFPEETMKLLDLEDKTILAEVKEYRDREIPPLAEIKDKVTAEYKNSEAGKLAIKAGEALLQKAQDKATLDELTKDQTSKTTLEEPKELSRAKPLPGVYALPELLDELYTHRTPTTLPELYEAQGDYYVVRLEKVSKPTKKEIKEEGAKFRRSASGQNAQLLLASLVNKLKTDIELDIAPGLVE